MIVADLGRLRRRDPLRRRRAALILDKTGEHLALSGAAMGVALARRAPARHPPRAPPPRLVPGRQRREHRPGAAEPRGHRRGISVLGIGFVNTTFALVILAIPPILTNAYVAVDGVDADAVEAARGMGMTRRQIIRRSSSRSRCRSSSPASARRPSSSSRLPRSRRSPAAAGSATSSSTSPLRPRRRRRRGDVRLDPRPRRRCAARRSPALSRRRVSAEAHPLEPDVVTGVTP